MKKILVVEDSILVSNLVKMQLESVGYEVYTAFDGSDAIKKIETHNLNLIVLDLMLPKISGLEILRGIVSKKYTDRAIPTLVISSNDSDSYKRKSLELGAKCFIKKPFDLEEVALQIEKHILGED